MLHTETREGRKGTEEAHKKGHRGVNKHCFDGLPPIGHQQGPGWGFFWGGVDPQVDNRCHVLGWGRRWPKSKPE